MSLLMIMVIIWGALAVVLVGLIIYRAVIGIHEEDQIFLDQVEAALEKEQVEILQRINRLDPIIKGFAIATGALLLIIATVWVYQALNTIQW